MDAGNHTQPQKIQSNRNLFTLDRQYIPDLLKALHTEQEDAIAEQLVGADYALYLLLAVEAAQQRANSLVDIAACWSPPLHIDLALCSIDCKEKHFSDGTKLLVFWFYEASDPNNWMEGFGEQFFDFTVQIDLDQLSIYSVSGPSR
ncbi:hypothetical protein SK066_12975 [Paenibacillus hunanensis]|uniref:hypothetical protein n=1 Tax=Paenibacillus hunanensis TaxID=539262 RepID=UPI002A6AC8E6|nr:hypothetical protein [Paenibacillus hunanensis]WPP39542.1 hypothetical protein SK066_12975 [Paenibacillus hunanensis]